MTVPFQVNLSPASLRSLQILALAGALAAVCGLICHSWRMSGWYMASRRWCL